MWAEAAVYLFVVALVLATAALLAGSVPAMGAAFLIGLAAIVAGVVGHVEAEREGRR